MKIYEIWAMRKNDGQILDHSTTPKKSTAMNVGKALAKKYERVEVEVADYSERGLEQTELIAAWEDGIKTTK